MNFLIPDKKLTDNEIKKALNVCVGMQNDCGDCPLLEYSKASDECMTELMSNALGLINRLQAENKRLSALTELGNTRANDYRVMRDRALKAEAENERLKKSNRNWRRKVQRLRADLNVDLEGYASEYDNKIKAEAYKECIEKAIEELYDWVGANNAIYYSRIESVLVNLLKELTEKTN